MSDSIHLEDRAQGLGHYPHAKRVGDLLFVSGTSSRRPDNSHEGVGDVAVQTEAVIKNIQKILQAAGLELENLVDMTTFLVNMDDFKSYNDVYNRYFVKETGPARTTVAVHQLPHPNLLIEIKAIAAFPT